MVFIILQLLNKHTGKPLVPPPKAKEHSKLGSSTDVRIKCARNKHVLVHSQVITALSKGFKETFSKAMKDPKDSLDHSNHYPMIDDNISIRYVFVAIWLLYFGKAFITEEEKVEEKLENVLKFLQITNRFQIKDIDRVSTGDAELVQFRNRKLRVCIDGIPGEKSLFDFSNDSELSVNNTVHAMTGLTMSINSRSENCFCEFRNCKQQLFTLTELDEHMTTHHKC